MSDPVSFTTVFTAELKAVDARRAKLGLDVPNSDQGTISGIKEAQANAHRRSLVGLAFSGGGIRSATFNLGILQGLAGLGLLHLFDYLSTVSGGGYIGAWLTAWIKHEAGGALAVERQLQPDKVRQSAAAVSHSPNVVSPIRHLREHTNYLAPREGFMSADRWVLWAAYLRNFLLNQLMLLPVAFGLMLLSRLMLVAYYPYMPADDERGFVEGFLYGSFGDRRTLPWACFALLMFLFAALVVVGLTQSFRAAMEVQVGGEAKATSGWLLGWVVTPLTLAAIVFCFIGPYDLYLSHAIYTLKLPPFLRSLSWVADLLVFMICAALLVTFSYWLALRGSESSPKVLFWCAFAGLVWGASLFGVYRLLYFFLKWEGYEPLMYDQISGTALVTTLGPPFVLLSLVLGIAIGVGLLRDKLTEELREWWASLSARLLMTSACWAAINLVALYGTAFVLWIGPWARAAVASGWLLTVATGVLAGGSRRTNGARSRSSVLDLLSRYSFYAFVVGIFILVSLLVHRAVDQPPEFSSADEAVLPQQDEPERAPTTVSVTRLGTSGSVLVQRKKEFLRVPNEAKLVRQQYWLGMLSADANMRPLLLWLTDSDVARLADEIGNAEDLRKRLRPLRQWQRDDFVGRLRQLLRDKCDGPTRESLLARILRLAQEKGADPETRTFDFRVEYVAGTDLPDNLTMADLRQVEYPQWRYEEFQDKLDELFPEAWNQEYKKAILRFAMGAWPSPPFERRWVLLRIALWLSGSALLIWLAARRVDVNAFSLHNLYQNRLVRAYLGASRAKAQRNANPVTGFDPNDDIELASLKDGCGGPYDGPFLLVNTAMNLVHTKNLAWQERKAEAFVLTPAYCGSDTTDYRATMEGDRTYAGGVKLGTAIALSGAAASPNMGYHSSAAVTFLLTVFNARLGAWLGNPKNTKHWRESGPRNGFLYLFRELAGWTDESAPYVYLSDGGHFENLGAYELVKRRCQYVVVCDAGQDGAYSFEDLGNLIRKVRIDMGIRIEIAPDCLRLQKDPRHSRWHCALGKIRYDDVDEGALPGTLVYLKASLTGDEPADVLNFAASHPAFPHETTANQFYTESQFESYRALGQHIAEAVFEQSVADAVEETKHLSSKRDGRWCRSFFASLRRRWFAMPPQYESAFIESTKGFMEVQTALRSDTKLRSLALDFYPELLASASTTQGSAETDADELTFCLTSVNSGSVLGPAPTCEGTSARRAAELHMLAQMVQVMENAYLSLNLEVNYAHPLNRGWMDVFHRWTSAASFRSHWKHLRGEYSAAFVRFCEREMHIGEITGKPVPLDPSVPPDDRLKRLLLELTAEWPTKGAELEAQLQTPLTDIAAVGHEQRTRFIGSQSEGQPPFAERHSHAWAIYPIDRHSSAPAIFAYPVGVLRIWPVALTDATSSPPTFDLFIWLRGAYRNTGLGRPAMEQVLSELRNRWGTPFRLSVRLPKMDMTGPGGKLQESSGSVSSTSLSFHEYGRRNPKSNCNVTSAPLE